MLFHSLDRVRGVQGPDGFSDRQDPGIVEFSPVLYTYPTNENVEAPRAIDPVFHTYPTSQINLVQINHHVQVEQAGHVQMVQVPDGVPDDRVSDDMHFTGIQSIQT